MTTKFDFISDWKKDIGSEDSIYEVVFKAAPLIGGKLETAIVLILLLLSVIVPVVCGVWLPQYVSGAEKQLEFCHAFSGLVIGYYASLLGFITAAFSIILGLFDKSVFIALASIKNRKRGISEFKFMFFAFLYALFVFGFFLVVSTFFWVGSFSESFLTLLGENRAARVLFLIANSMQVIAFLYSVLQLKTLVWNVYQIVLADIIESSKEKVEN
ncbi:hypothetical protein [Hyphomonas sp. UBA4494]|jgi:hypothetical protein|uniref:hypothetical protein n=1 Tax=Hyphomonas sp. UBA4494 TaxID=1946631 RepID=UPI0025BED478|nr:hypothetical protein [Hyphomonas sp. UBA4494]